MLPTDRYHQEAVVSEHQIRITPMFKHHLKRFLLPSTSGHPYRRTKSGIANPLQNELVRVCANIEQHFDSCYVVSGQHPDQWSRPTFAHGVYVYTTSHQPFGFGGITTDYSLK